jgi:hypothetical protein
LLVWLFSNYAKVLTIDFVVSKYIIIKITVDNF